MPSKIMLIRHGEKPLIKHEPPYGVTIDGEQDWESLTVRGWLRAGALQCLFEPLQGQPSQPLAKPAVIYASKPRTPGLASSADDASKSKRPIQTITPLAAKLGISPNLSFGKGDEAALAADVLGQSGVVLVSWQHEKIQEIVGNLLQGKATDQPVPSAKWPDDRYDVVWVLTPPGPDSERWKFEQVPQLVLSGDEAEGIALRPLS